MKKFLLIICLASSLMAHRLVIIVPGTWSAKEQWHTPAGAFFQAIQRAVGPDVPVTNYLWSGTLSYDARVYAGHGLAEFILICPPETVIIIVAHSHGGNVVYHASQELYQRGYRSRIHVLYTLGTPCSEWEALPHMDVIDYAYNLFSFADIVQPVQGAYGRTLPVHERCCNLQLIVNGQEPDHSALHQPIVGTWLIQIHEQLMAMNHAFDFTAPGTLFINEHERPRYTLDPDREYDLLMDYKFHHDLGLAFNRKR